MPQCFLAPQLLGMGYSSFLLCTVLSAFLRKWSEKKEKTQEMHLFLLLIRPLLSKSNICLPTEVTKERFLLERVIYHTVFIPDIPIQI